MTFGAYFAASARGRGGAGPDEQRDDFAAVGLRGGAREREVRERARAERGAGEFTECEDVTHRS